MFKQEIALGEMGKLVVAEEAGEASIEIALSQALGGGQAAGVVHVQAGAKAVVEVKQIIDLGLDLAAAKFPMAAPLIMAAKAEIDAQLLKA